MAMNYAAAKGHGCRIPNGYSYLTDALREIPGFRTGYQFIACRGKKYPQQADGGFDPRGIRKTIFHGFKRGTRSTQPTCLIVRRDQIQKSNPKK